MSVYIHSIRISKRTRLWTLDSRACNHLCTCIQLCYSRHQILISISKTIHYFLLVFLKFKEKSTSKVSIIVPAILVRLFKTGKRKADLLMRNFNFQNNISDKILFGKIYTFHKQIGLSIQSSVNTFITITYFKTQLSQSLALILSAEANSTI